MPGYQYQNNTHQENRSKRRSRLYIGAIFVIVLIFGLFLFADLFKEEDVILESSGTVLSEKDAVVGLTFTEKFFEFQTPAEWARGESEWDENYDVWRYDSVAETERGRYFEVFMNKIPKSLYFNKAQKVIIEDNALVAGEMSDQCYIYGNETGERQDYIHEKTQVEWKKIEFTCHPSNILNTIGAFNEEQGNGLALKGSYGDNTFYFVYVDDNIQQKNFLFGEILESFKVL